jgi:hypothetical protein
MSCYRSATAVESIFIFPCIHAGFRCFAKSFAAATSRISGTKQIKSTRNALYSDLKILPNGRKLGVLLGNMRPMLTNCPDGPTKQKKGKIRGKRVILLTVLRK